MNIEWPPERTVTYEAKNPERENGLVINAEVGGNPKKAKKVRRDTTGAER